MPIVAYKKIAWFFLAGTILPLIVITGTGTYEASWDENLGDPGAHVLYAQATDSNSEQGSDSTNVTVSSGSFDFHVQSIEVTAVHHRGPRYFGRAVVTMVDAGNALLTSVTGSITGTVTDDNGVKQVGVKVTTDSGHSSVTNRGGKYTIQNVPEGSHDVTASKSGFVDGFQNIVVIAGQTTIVNFSLAPRP